MYLPHCDLFCASITEQTMETFNYSTKMIIISILCLYSLTFALVFISLHLNRAIEIVGTKIVYQWNTSTVNNITNQRGL